MESILLWRTSWELASSQLTIPLGMSPKSNKPTFLGVPKKEFSLQNHPWRPVLEHPKGAAVAHVHQAAQGQLEHHGSLEAHEILDVLQQEEA